MKVWCVRGRWGRQAAKPRRRPAERKPFDAWYVPGGKGSGSGSTPAYTEKWRGFLRAFLDRHGVRTVLDFGCGDWQHSRLIDWGDRPYFGVDVVPGLIARLKADFGSPTRLFLLVDPRNPVLPDADLLICKDVLQHLPNATIQGLLPILRRFRHALFVNDKSKTPGDNNRDCRIGGWRCLDLSAPPFRLRVVDIFRFGSGQRVKTAQWLLNAPELRTPPSATAQRSVR